MCFSRIDQLWKDLCFVGLNANHGCFVGDLLIIQSLRPPSLHEFHPSSHQSLSAELVRVVDVWICYQLLPIESMRVYWVAFWLSAFPSTLIAVQRFEMVIHWHSVFKCNCKVWHGLIDKCIGNILGRVKCGIWWLRLFLFIKVG